MITITITTITTITSGQVKFLLVPLGQGFNLMYNTWILEEVKWSGTIRKEEEFPKNEHFLLFYE